MRDKLFAQKYWVARGRGGGAKRQGDLSISRPYWGELVVEISIVLFATMLWLFKPQPHCKESHPADLSNLGGIGGTRKRRCTRRPERNKSRGGRRGRNRLLVTLFRFAKADEVKSRYGGLCVLALGYMGSVEFGV